MIQLQNLGYMPEHPDIIFFISSMIFTVYVIMHNLNEKYFYFPVLFYSGYLLSLAFRKDAHPR